MMTRVMLSLLWFVSVENRSIVKRCIGQHSVSSGNVCIMLVGCTYVSCGRIFGNENRVDCDVRRGE